MAKLTNGERLRMAREETGLTKTRLAELSGLYLSRITSFETDARVMTTEEAKILSSTLQNVSAAFLLGLEGPRSSSLHPVERPPKKAPTSTLTLDGICDHLVNECRLNREEAMDFLTTWFDAVRKKVDEGYSVRLSGFGTLIPRTLKTTGERKVIFSPAQQLKARIQR